MQHNDDDSVDDDNDNIADDAGVQTIPQWI